MGEETGGGRVEIVGRATTTEIGGRMQVEWALSTEPALEWIEVFQFAELPDREGPDDWAMGPGPDVIDRSVRWFVPAGRPEAAEDEVRRRAAIANERTPSPGT